MNILNKDKILEAAKDFVAQSKFDKAIKEYEKILIADSKDMRVKLRIAELFAKCRRIPEAIKAYREVGEYYAAEGFYLKAVTVFKNILRLNPSLLELNQSLADLYEKMGLNKDAVHQYDILAAAFEQKNRYPEALKVRQKLVELAPHDAGHRIRLAESYQREERKEEAIEQYEILAKQFREQKKEPARLIELYERILPSRPQNIDMLSELVHLYHDKKDFKAALKWLEQNKKVASGRADLLLLQAEMYGTLNQLETARGKYQELAELYMRQGEKEKALKSYGEILVLVPEEAETIQTFVEAIDPSAMDKLLRQAEARREKKAEELKAEEDAVEREKEERERARDAKRGTTDRGGGTMDHGPRTMDKGKGTTDQGPRTMDKKPGEVDKWLKVANTALSLAKAYKATGLESESQQELAHAREVLKKILEVNSSHAEAQKLLTGLMPKESKPAPSPRAAPKIESLKGKKKISFV